MEFWLPLLLSFRAKDAESGSLEQESFAAHVNIQCEIDSDPFSIQT